MRVWLGPVGGLEERLKGQGDAMGDIPKRVGGVVVARMVAVGP